MCAGRYAIGDSRLRADRPWYHPVVISETGHPQRLVMNFAKAVWCRSRAAFLPVKQVS